MPRNWHRYISNMNTDAGRAIVEQGNRIHEARQNLSEKQYLRASLITILRTVLKPPCQRWCHSCKGLGNRGWIFPGYDPGLNDEKFAPADVG